MVLLLVQVEDLMEQMDQIQLLFLSLLLEVEVALDNGQLLDALVVLVEVEIL